MQPEMQSCALLAQAAMQCSITASQQQTCCQQHGPHQLVDFPLLSQGETSQLM
jgi:hypothetical protein